MDKVLPWLFWLTLKLPSFSRPFPPECLFLQYLKWYFHSQKLRRQNPVFALPADEARFSEKPAGSEDFPAPYPQDTGRFHLLPHPHFASAIRPSIRQYE